MNFSRVESPTYLISIFLDANALCLTMGKKIWANLMPKLMRVYSQGTPQLAKAYIIYNKRTMTIEESVHVTFDESNPKGLERKVDDLVGTL